MKTIRKFPLDMRDTQTVEVDPDVEWLHAGLDAFGHACLWGLVDPDAQTFTCVVCVVGTGNPAGHVDGLDHVGSFVQGPLVWHVFAEGTF